MGRFAATLALARHRGTPVHEALTAASIARQLARTPLQRAQARNALHKAEARAYKAGVRVRLALPGPRGAVVNTERQEALAARARGVARAYGKIIEVPVSDACGHRATVEVHVADCCCLPCILNRRNP